jgi:hypothetical protein
MTKEELFGQCETEYVENYGNVPTKNGVLSLLDEYAKEQVAEWKNKLDEMFKIVGDYKAVDWQRRPVFDAQQISAFDEVKKFIAIQQQTTNTDTK